MPDFAPESVAFVTGAASGIGYAVARQLILDGIHHLVIVDRADESLRRAIESLGKVKEGPDVVIIAVTADCSDETDVNSAVQTAVDQFGRLDICFNAAGISGNGGAIADTDVSELDRILGVNLRGLWLCERAQIRQMMKQELRDVATGLPLKTRGSIVNVGSLTSHAAISNLSPYIMSKHGVLGLTKSDAFDYGKEGIRVNCICPGWISTNMTQVFHAGGEAAAAEDSLLARAPMARWGKPEEVAFMASFLLSDKASFVTGAAINVDGGYGAC